MATSTVHGYDHGHKANHKEVIKAMTSSHQGLSNDGEFSTNHQGEDTQQQQKEKIPGHSTMDEHNMQRTTNGHSKAHTANTMQDGRKEHTTGTHTKTGIASRAIHPIERSPGGTNPTEHKRQTNDMTGKMTGTAQPAASEKSKTTASIDTIANWFMTTLGMTSPVEAVEYATKAVLEFGLTHPDEVEEQFGPPEYMDKVPFIRVTHKKKFKALMKNKKPAAMKTTTENRYDPLLDPDENPSALTSFHTENHQKDLIPVTSQITPPPIHNMQRHEHHSRHDKRSDQEYGNSSSRRQPHAEHNRSNKTTNTTSPTAVVTRHQDKNPHARPAMAKPNHSHASSVNKERNTPEFPMDQRHIITYQNSSSQKGNGTQDSVSSTTGDIGIEQANQDQLATDTTNKRDSDHTNTDGNSHRQAAGTDSHDPTKIRMTTTTTTTHVSTETLLTKINPTETTSPTPLRTTASSRLITKRDQPLNTTAKPQTHTVDTNNGKPFSTNDDRSKRDIQVLSNPSNNDRFDLARQQSQSITMENNNIQKSDTINDRSSLAISPLGHAHRIASSPPESPKHVRRPKFAHEPDATRNLDIHRTTDLQENTQYNEGNATKTANHVKGKSTNHTSKANHNSTSLVRKTPIPPSEHQETFPEPMSHKRHKATESHHLDMETVPEEIDSMTPEDHDMAEHTTHPPRNHTSAAFPYGHLDMEMVPEEIESMITDYQEMATHKTTSAVSPDDHLDMHTAPEEEIDAMITADHDMANHKTTSAVSPDDHLDIHTAPEEEIHFMITDDHEMAKHNASPHTPAASSHDNAKRSSTETQTRLHSAYYATPEKTTTTCTASQPVNGHATLRLRGGGRDTNDDDDNPFADSEDESTTLPNIDRSPQERQASSYGGSLDTDTDDDPDETMDLDEPSGNSAVGNTGNFHTKMTPREQLQAFLSWNEGKADSTKIMAFLRAKQWHISYHKIILSEMEQLPLRQKRRRLTRAGNPSTLPAEPTPVEDSVDTPMLPPTEINPTTTVTPATGLARHTDTETLHQFSIRATFLLPEKKATLFNPRMAIKDLHTKLMECQGSIHICHLTDNSSSFASMEHFPDKDNFSKFFNVQAQAKRIHIVFSVKSHTSFGHLKQHIFPYLQQERIYLNMQSFSAQNVQHCCGVLIGPGAHPRFTYTPHLETRLKEAVATLQAKEQQARMQLAMPTSRNSQSNIEPIEFTLKIGKLTLRNPSKPRDAPTVIEGIQVETSKANLSRLSKLLITASSSAAIPMGQFIPLTWFRQFHDNVQKHFRAHNAMMSQARKIPVMGLNTEVAYSEQHGESPPSLAKTLCFATTTDGRPLFLSIEKTKDTADSGRWFFVYMASHHNEAVDFIDNQLPDLVTQNPHHDPDQYPNFPSPRRSLHSKMNDPSVYQDPLLPSSKSGPLRLPSRRPKVQLNFESTTTWASVASPRKSTRSAPQPSQPIHPTAAASPSPENNSWTDKFAALQAKQNQMESKFSSLHEKVTKNLQQQITEQSTRTDSMLDWMKKQQGIIEKMQETLIKLTEEHQHGRASKGSHNSNP